MNDENCTLTPELFLVYTLRAGMIEGEISSILASQFVFPASSNHLIRSGQYIRRNRQADVLCGFQVYDEFELRRLLDGEVSRLGAPFRILSIYVAARRHKSAMLTP